MCAFSLWQAATSALATTLAAFGLILVLVRLRVPLSLSILGGALALGVFNGQGARAILPGVWRGATEPQTIGLVAIVMLMLVLSDAMRRAGQLDEIVSLAREFLRRPAIAMAALPALIGLMPMPGGAQLSAPMVEAAAGSTEVAPDRLSAINYWFRHIWEYWWPLYPGVMVAMSITGSDVATFVPPQLPMTAVMAASGLLIFRGSHGDLHRTGPRPPSGHAMRLLRATSPIWLILLVWGAVRAALALLPPAAGEGETAEAIRRYGPLGVGLAVSLAWTFRRNRLGRRDVRALLARPALYTLVASVIGVMVFWHGIRQADAAARIARELADLRVPPVVVVAALPFIAGLVTGLAVGFVGTSFPIVMAVVAAGDPGGSIRPYVALAYAFGHLGQMVSPLHICQVLSNEYFRVPPRATYRWIALPALLTALGVTGYFFLLKALWG